MAGLGAARQDALIAAVQSAWNWPAPEAGFAKLVLASVQGLSTAVSALALAAADRLHLDRAPRLAAAGYAYALGEAPSDLDEAWAGGLARLSDRDALPADRMSFAFEPLELLGIVHGALRCAAVDPASLWWLRQAVQQLESLLQPRVVWNYLLSHWAARLLGVAWRTRATPPVSSWAPEEVALGRWLARQQHELVAVHGLGDIEQRSPVYLDDMRLLRGPARAALMLVTEMPSQDPIGTSIAPSMEHNAGMEMPNHPSQVSSRLRDTPIGGAVPNQPYLDTLRQRYLAGRLVLFAGAGVAQAGGLPSWPVLIRRVLDYARADCSAPETVLILDRAAELLARGDLILALSELQRAMTSVGYGQAVSGALDDRPHAVPRLAQAIASLAPTLLGIVTTNLDRFLERAFAGAWPVYTLPQLDLGQHDHTILKLHGCRTDRNSWVLTRREYDALMHRRPELRDHMRGLYRFATLLFVGYGLRDPDLDDLLAEFRALAAGAPPQHFALMPRGQIDEASRRHLFAEAGLTVLEYDPADGHRELLEILADLAGAQTRLPPLSVVHDLSHQPQPPAAPADNCSETREQALHALLSSLFTESHLRRFLGFGEQGSTILLALPGGNPPLATLVDGAVAELIRRGIVASIWRRLHAEFPARSADIGRVAALWSHASL